MILQSQHCQIMDKLHKLILISRFETNYLAHVSDIVTVLLVDNNDVTQYS